MLPAGELTSCAVAGSSATASEASSVCNTVVMFPMYPCVVITTIVVSVFECKGTVYSVAHCCTGGIFIMPGPIDPTTPVYAEKTSDHESKKIILHFSLFSYLSF